MSISPLRTGSPTGSETIKVISSETSSKRSSNAASETTSSYKPHPDAPTSVCSPITALYGFLSSILTSVRDFIMSFFSSKPSETEELLSTIDDQSKPDVDRLKALSSLLEPESGSKEDVQKAFGSLLKSDDGEDADPKDATLRLEIQAKLPTVYTIDDLLKGFSQYDRSLLGEAVRDVMLSKNAFDV